MDPVELRRHLLGRYAWSWCTLAGVDDIESAAHGDAAAAARLFTHPRYYGGHAKASLTVLLGLDPAETRERIAAATPRVRSRCRRPVRPTSCTPRTRRQRHCSSPAVRSRRSSTWRRLPVRPGAGGRARRPRPPPRAVASARARAAPLLAAHRLPVCTGPQPRGTPPPFGRALGDWKRVEILSLVGRGVGRAADLVDATGLTRSTVHHHLAQLRAAGLVALEGNARAYTYVPRREAAANAAALVADIVGTEEE